MNAPFEWAPLFTTEKFNEHPGLNERPLKPGKRRSFGNLPCLEALIQIVCKNAECQIFFVFYNKEIYKHIL